jgi:pimeloyl-ACP methyl ester carboxylesterase
MKLHSVPVAGGALAVEELPGSTQPVLAVHGVSSQRKLWSWLRAEAPEISLLAPDLRGRGDSVDVAGPSSMAQHAEDMVAVLDALGLDAVHVVGMSMGGFVAVHLAHLHPERVKSLVLVDGGFPMAAPPGLTVEMLPVVFKDRLDRLEQRWDSLDDYLAFFTSSTAPLLDPADPLLREYLAHDLRDGLVRLSGQALLDDAADIYLNETPWQSLTQPIRFSHAQWASGAGTSPAYPEEALRTYLPATVSSRYVEGQDHAGSIMTKAGAVAAAELLTEALG